MSDYVLDPAIACKWFLPTAGESQVVEARFVLDHLARGQITGHVPTLFHYELAAWVQAEGTAVGLEPEQAWAAIRKLPFVEHPLDRDLAANAYLSARRHDVDFYTAVYLALAERLVCPFLTADESLAVRLAGTTRIHGLPLPR